MPHDQTVTIELGYEEFVGTEIAPRISGNKPATYDAWRSQGKGPKFRRADPDKPGSKIEYRVGDVVMWMEKQMAAQPAPVRRMLDLAIDRAKMDPKAA